MVKKRKRLLNGSGTEHPVPGTTPERRHRMIEEAAYYRVLYRGFYGGDPMMDWLEAKRDIDKFLMPLEHRNDRADTHRPALGTARTSRSRFTAHA